jgi:hypothetical protein
MLCGLAGKKIKDIFFYQKPGGMSNKTRGLRAGCRSDKTGRSLIFYCSTFPFSEFSGSIFIIVRKIKPVHITKGE